MRDAAVGTTTIQVTEIETDTDATTIASASFTDFTIGALEDNSLGDYFNGRVAIVDISNTTRSANYRTTRKNGWDDDLFGHWNKAETYAANSTGWFEFTSAVSTTPGTDVWSNPSFALTNLNTAAEVAVEEGDFSQTLKVTNASSFLSSYDDALEIVGIEAEIAFLGDNGGSEEMEDSTLQVIISGAQTGTNKATRTLWETTPVPLYVNAGGSSDIWGLSSPTMADFKATTSGLALQLESVGGVSSEPAVDCLRMRMRLHYAAAASVDSGFFAMMEAF